MRACFLKIGLVTLAVCFSTPALSLANSKTPEQALFLQAETAIQQGKSAKTKQLMKRLQNYPLLPYLELAQLRRGLRASPPAEVKAFLSRYAGQPVADMLRRNWLDQLAQQKRWKTYLAFYTPQGNIRRQCDHLHAMLKTGQSQQAWPEVTKLWLHGKSRPSACDPVFKAWEQAGKRNNQLNWQRIALAMEKGEWRLARYIGKPLSNDDRVWLSRWIRLYKSPRDALRHQDFTQAHPYREAMLSQAARRLAAFDGEEGLKLWQQIAQRYPFSNPERYRIKRRIALALERNPSAEAYQFIHSISPKADDERLLLARLRAALIRNDWAQVLTDLRLWPANKSVEMVAYWRARALAAEGQPELATRQFNRLAQHRSYYGFLAADHIGANYHFAHTDTPVNNLTLQQVQQNDGIARALELHKLVRDTLARREWHYASRHFSKTQLKAAATLAEANDWHDQAIFTLARTGFWDDLELRFPLQHQQLVAKYAQQRQIDSSWIFAVIRQESAFMRDARSHAGARGLMQLMPATAKRVARKALGQRRVSKKALLKADTNIALGSHYLRQLKERLNDNPVLATAAYNAGPHRVDRWLPRHDLAADIWVELVPFNETRKYLRRVLYYASIYDQRQGKKPKRISDRMPTIMASVGKLASN